MKSSLPRAARIQCNRLIAIAVLAIALPAIIVVGRFSRAKAAALATSSILLAARLTGVRFERVGAPISPATRPQILVANHGSLLDAAALLAVHQAAVHQAAVHSTVRFVAAADLFRIPLLAGAMRALGAVPVDRRSGRGVRLDVPGLAAGRSNGPLVIFPEGRLAPTGQRLAFKRGAFALAIESGADVIPVAIHHSARVLPPGRHLGVVPGTVTVEYLPRLSTAGLAPADRHRLCEQARQAILDALDAEDGGRAPTGAGGTDATGTDPVRA